jgi:hypothetical protein
MIIFNVDFMTSNYKFEIVRLAPEEVDDQLIKYINNETIHDWMLIVWDIVSTFYRSGSDYMKSDAISILPHFSPFSPIFPHSSPIFLVSFARYKATLEFTLLERILLPSYRFDI